MTRARLTIARATDGVTFVYGDEEFAAGDLQRGARLETTEIQIGEVSVSLTVPDVIGAVLKPVPPGLHRALLEISRDEGVTWATLLDGTVSNERASHGRAYGTPPDGPHAGADVRRWGLTVADTAIDRAWDALEVVQVAGLGGVAPVAIETVRVGGNGLTSAAKSWWPLRDLVAAAVGAAGLTLAGDLPPCLPSDVQTPAGAHRTETAVVVASLATANTRPPWTGARLLEAWMEAQRLVVSASYAPFPSTAVVIRIGESRHPGDVAPGRPDLTEHAEDYDWSTEPGDVDGQVYDDLAVTWLGGVDGSRIEQLGVADPPMSATYAARRPALKGTPAAHRDTGRETQNAASVELPFRLPAHDAASAETVNRTDGAYAETVRLARPAYDGPTVEVKASDGSGGEPDVVYVASVAAGAGGALRSVTSRTPTGGAETMELWAGALFAGFEADYGDSETVELSVPDDVLDVAGVVLGDPAQGVLLEGLPWTVRSIDAGADARRVSLTLSRPSATAGASGSGPIGGPRYEPAPAIVATTTTSREESQGGEITTEFRLAVEASLPAEADGPLGIDIETVPMPEILSARLVRHNVQTGYQGEYDPARPNPYVGTTWRARARYASGVVTAWTDTIVS